MKSNWTLALGLAALVFFATLLRAEDWTTTDGTIYQDVKVVKMEPDAVTILHRTGGALVPLLKLSPELQKRFNYDPTKAQAAAAARVIADAENTKALEAEIAQARQQRQAAAEALDAGTSGASASSSTASDASSSDTGSSGLLTSGSTMPNHHPASELVDVNQRLWDEHLDSVHNSMGHLLITSHSLMGDYADPTHHSTDQLFSDDPLK